MGSLKLQTDKRNKLYFGKYKYRTTVKVVGANYIWRHASIELVKFEMQKKLNKLNNLKSSDKYSHEIDWINESTEIINLADYDKIAELIILRNDTSEKYTTRINGQNVSFYSDDLGFLESTATKFDDNPEFFQAIIPVEKGVMLFKKEPKFKFRTYFKSRFVSEQIVMDLKDFLDRYDISKGNTTLKANSTLKSVSGSKWFKYTGIYGSSYVDYNDESTLTLLNMFFSEIIGKTYRLMKET